MLPDEELISACQRELPYNTTAFEQLLERYEARVYRSCLALLGNPDDAADASQDVLLAVFHGLPSFRGEAQFHTWLHTLIRRHCMREVDRQARWRGQADAPAQALTPAADHPPQARTPGHAEAVASMVLAQLPRGEREVLLLRHIAELSLQDIANLLDISLSAAKMRLYRAEARFKERFGDRIGEKLTALILWLLG